MVDWQTSCRIQVHKILDTKWQCHMTQLCAAILGKKEMLACGVETEGLREQVEKVSCAFMHMCTVMLTSKLGSMRRMYCSMGW